MQFTSRRATAGVSAVVVSAVVGAAVFVGVRVQGQDKTSPPTIEQLRKAVASLRGDRIKRPASFDEMTPEQKALVTNILSGPRGDISGSLGVMLASPAFGELAQKTIAYARFAGTPGYSSVPPRLTELTIIMGARAWTAQYAWYVHRRAAERAGVSAAVIEAVRDGRRPVGMDKEMEAIYDFLHELLTTQQVSDATFQTAKTVLKGDKGIVDLVGTLGAYQLVAMMMVVDRFPLPDGVAPELKPLK